MAEEENIEVNPEKDQEVTTGETPEKETEVEPNGVLISKHCPNPDCPLYMLPQPNRTYCIECDTKLVA